MFEGKETLWVVHIGNDDSAALRARDEGFVCIGWTKLGDLSQFSTREAMRAAMEKAWPDWKQKKVSSSYGQVFRFAHTMKVGDPIVFPIRPTSQVAIGRISGDYKWASDDAELVEKDYCNVRPVEWLKVVPRTDFSKPALHSFGSFLSVSTSDDHLEEVLLVLAGDSKPAEDEAAPPAEPEEDDDSANLYEVARQETEDYLLKAWLNTGHHFERVVAAVLEAIGYTANVTQKSGDHGVDVIAHPDPLGLEKPYIKVQAKSGAGTVNEATVNQLKGCLNQGEQGIVVGLGGFTSGAQSVARSSSQLTLLNGQQFVALFLDHYDDLAPEWRAKYPLKHVFVPFQ